MPFGYVAFYLITAIVLLAVFSARDDRVAGRLLHRVAEQLRGSAVSHQRHHQLCFRKQLPPQDPTYAGVKFTYPFLTDFISAIFVQCGAIHSPVDVHRELSGSVAFVGLLHRWAFVMLRNRLAAVITPVLVILNGGLGWVMFVSGVGKTRWVRGVSQKPAGLLHNYSGDTWRWGNAVSTLLIPQRGFLLGLPLAVIVFTQWWLATQ